MNPHEPCFLCSTPSNQGRQRAAGAHPAEAFICALAIVLLAGTHSVRAEPAHDKAWTSIGLSGGGGMFTPAISPAVPNLLLVNCDMSGVYRSTNGGQNWELIHYRQLTSSTRVRPVWHPADASVAFAAGGATLKMTRDRGLTWSAV